MYPPRPVQGFYTKDELELLIQRRTTRKPLASVPRSTSHRRAVLPGAGDPPDRARPSSDKRAQGAARHGHRRRQDADRHRACRPADALQSGRSASSSSPTASRSSIRRSAHSRPTCRPCSPVNLVTEREQEGRVYVSTYPTMMGLIDEMQDGPRRFGPGHFDLIVIDEAHRSVYQKYRRHLRLLRQPPRRPHCDAQGRGRHQHLPALRAGARRSDRRLLTSKTRSRTGGLSGPAVLRCSSVKFQREGIKYKDLSDEEKEEWDALEWDEDGDVPDRVEAAALNALALQRGHRRQGSRPPDDGWAAGRGRRPARQDNHLREEPGPCRVHRRAVRRQLPAIMGAFRPDDPPRVNYAQTLIDDFSIPEKAPHIAVSVDMLDTGIDVPEIVNLVFFKPVRSKTKFWQMVGRGTRLRPDLFGPGR